MVQLSYGFLTILLLITNICSNEWYGGIRISDVLSGNRSIFNKRCQFGDALCYLDQKLLLDNHEDKNWICYETENYRMYVSTKPVGHFDLRCDSNGLIFPILDRVSSVPFPSWTPFRRKDNTKPFEVNASGVKYFNIHSMPFRIVGKFKNNNCLIFNGTNLLAVNCNRKYHQVCLKKSTFNNEYTAFDSENNNLYKFRSSNRSFVLEYGNSRQNSCENMKLAEPPNFYEAYHLFEQLSSSSFERTICNIGIELRNNEYKFVSSNKAVDYIKFLNKTISGRYGLFDLRSHNAQLVFSNNTDDVNCSICQENISPKPIQVEQFKLSVQIDSSENNIYLEKPKTSFNGIRCYEGNPKLEIKKLIDSNLWNDCYPHSDQNNNSDKASKFFLRYLLINNSSKEIFVNQIPLYNTHYPRYYWCETLDLRSNIMYFYEDSVNIRIYNAIVDYYGPKNCYPIKNIPDQIIIRNHMNTNEEYANAIDLLYYNETSGVFKIVYQFARNLSSSDMNEKEYIKYIYETFNHNKKYKFITMYNTQFCLESDTRDSKSGILLHWPETRVNTVQVSKELCLDEQSIPVRRKCDFNIQNGPFWSSVNGSCTNQTNEIENKLHNLYLSNKSSVEILGNLSKISNKIRERPTVTEIDISVKIIEKSLSNILNSFASTTVNILEIVDDLIMTNRDVLKKAQNLFNSTDRLLYSVDKSIEQSVVLNSSEHIKVKSVILSKSTIVGWGINQNFQVTEIHSHQTSEIIMEMFRREKLTTAFYLSEENIKQLKQLRNFIDIKLITAFFQNDALFNGDPSSEDVKYQPPVRVMIKGFHGFFSSPLTILYKLKPGQNGIFTYWNFGLDNQQKPIKGQWKTIQIHFVADDIFIGKSYHPAYFSALITGHVEANFTLRLITIIGCSLSLASCAVVFMIFFIKRNLREQEGSKLFLNSLISIVSTYILFFVAEAIQRETQIANIKMICILVGMFLHYMLLAQFFWTLILSYFQYNRYVIVFGTDASYRILKYSFLTWLVPLIPISLGFCFNRPNQESHNDLCYVDKITLKYFVLLPIILILTSNLIILIMISYSLGFKNRLKVSKKYVPYIVRMLCFNFFFFGLNWISGIVLAIDFNNAILLYIFNITSTFQGFVVCCIFIFTSRNKIFSRNIRLRPIESSRETHGLIQSPVVDQLHRINAINSI